MTWQFCLEQPFGWECHVLEHERQGKKGGMGGKKRKKVEQESEFFFVKTPNGG